MFKQFLLSTMLGLTIGLFLVAFSAFAWNPPTALPPGENVPAPINVGDSSQVKSGSLWVNSFGTDGGATFGGDVGIGTVVPTHDLSIGNKKSIIYLGKDQSGPHGILFGDPTVGQGPHLFGYRTGPNRLLIEKNTDEGRSPSGTEVFYIDMDDDSAYFAGNVGIGQDPLGAQLTVNNPQTADKTGSVEDGIYVYANQATGAAISAEQGGEGWAGYFSGDVGIKGGELKVYSGSGELRGAWDPAARVLWSGRDIMAGGIGSETGGRLWLYPNDSGTVSTVELDAGSDDAGPFPREPYFLMKTRDGSYVFVVNGSQGNVGIGTLTPDANYKLDVVGGNINAAGFCISGDCKTAWGDAGKWLDSATAGDIYYDGGNVGINEISPNAKLVVVGEGDTSDGGNALNSVDIYSNTDGGTALYAEQSSAAANTYAGYFSGNVEVTGALTKGGTAVCLADGTGCLPVPEGQWTLAANGTDIYNSNSGNVGIGIDAPTYKFEVKGDAVKVSGLGPGISGASYENSYSVANQDNVPYDLAFKSDGTKMYIVGYQHKSVYQYSLSSAWDISTASYENSYSVANQASDPFDLAFKSDGTKMYILGHQHKSVYQYSLFSAWNISTASYENSYSVANQARDPYGLAFKSDGTKMYMTDYESGHVYQYSLFSAWNISTASYENIRYDVRGQASVPYDLAFKSDGTKMYVLDWINDNVYQYSLSSAWDISTASYENIRYSVRGQDTATLGVTFKSDDTKMYVAGAQHDKVYQYSVEQTGNLFVDGNVGIGTIIPGARLAIDTQGSMGDGIAVAVTSDNSALYAEQNGAGYAGYFSGRVRADKLTVDTIDPLYEIEGTKYATYVASVVGGVKEEYVGKGKLECSDRPENEKDCEQVIDFEKLDVGSDLWLWYNVIDFSKDTVDAFITPYGQYANIYYVIEGKKLIFRGDKPAEFSYRLIGKRFDWKDWPTLAPNQSESGGLKIE